MKFLFQFLNCFLQFWMHIWGTLSSRTQISLSLLITLLLSSPTFLLQKNPSTIGIHIRQYSKGQCLMHTLVYIRHLPQGQCSRMAHIDICLKGKCSRMVHIGVHCTLPQRTRLRNGTHWCTLYIAQNGNAQKWHIFV